MSNPCSGCRRITCIDCPAGETEEVDFERTVFEAVEEWREDARLEAAIAKLSEVEQLSETDNARLVELEQSWDASHPYHC